jgi:hypothetical protein
VHVELDILFGSADGGAGDSATPYVTITMSASASSSMTAAINTPNPTSTDPGSPFAEGAAARAAVQPTSEAMQSTAVTLPLSQTGDLSIEGCTPVEPVAVSQKDMSSTLDRVEEALDTVKTWKSATDTIKRVMDTVSPILQVCSITFLTTLL